MIISHRGNDIYGFKENTFIAIKSSLKSFYTDGVEFDIRKTKDNYFVVNHDLIHEEKIIKYTDYKNLDLIELKELLKNIKTKKIIIIEIKDNDINIESLYKIIKQFKNLNIWIHTFHYEVGLKFKTEYPNIKVGLIVGNVINRYKDAKVFDFVSLYYKVDNYEHKNKILWTVNDKKKIRNYYNKKVDIITDKPQSVIVR